MALYTYKCNLCEHSQKIRKSIKDFDAKDTEQCPECVGDMSFCIPTSGTAETYVTNKYLGKSKRKDLEGLLKTRMRNHDAKHEYAERIDKYGLEDSKDILDKVKK